MKWSLFFSAFLATIGVAQAGEPAALFGNVGHSEVPWTAARPDGHAPIGVMQDHAHSTGEVMVGFRYRATEMRGLGNGVDHVSEVEALDTYQLAPRSMHMSMYGLSLMWAPVDFVTLMGMTAFANLEMENGTSSLGTFNTTASGIADTQVTTIWRLLRLPRQQLLLNLGMSIPTGSIDKTDHTPRGPDTPLPYPMQLGSGSFELLPGATYVGQTFDYSWGAQVLADFRLGKNDRHWRRGHAVSLTAWFAYRFSNWMSTSGRLAYDHSGNVAGADPALNPLMSPAANPDRQARHRIAALLGANLYIPKAPLRDLRFAIEAGFVPFQSLFGTQLKTATLFTAGIQYGFAAY